MKKGQACIVQGCKSTKRSVRHRFPKDAVKSHVWACAVKNPELQQMTVEDRMKFYVCHQHFPQEAYKLTLSRCQLMDTAVPFLHIPEDPESPSMDISEEQSNGQTEHVSPGTSMRSDGVDEIQGESVLPLNLPDEEQPDIMNSSSLAQETTILGSMKRQAALDPKARALYKKAVLFKKKYDRLRRQLKKHRREMDPTTTTQLAEKFTASLTRVQKQFWEMLLRNSQHAPSARRFTVEQRLFCLSLYKQSPSCYRFLSSFFPLPSRTTLMKLLCKVPVKTGIMKEVIQHLQDKVQQMKDGRDKVCILIWDEVALEPHIKYDAAADRIVGFEDWGSRRTTKFADHCLVFMIKGIYSGWKVPVSYNFCESQTSSVQLMFCIKEVVRAIESTGLQIVASVCDQGSSNMSAIERLVFETNRQRFHHDKQPGDVIKIGKTTFHHIYDVPHLLKGTRNNLLTKDLEVDVHPEEVRKYIVGKGRRKFASWDIVQLAYTIDTNGPSRQLKKLSDEHIILDKIKKMKVKYATQVFSETLANYIEFAATISGHINSRIGPLKMPEAEGLETARTLKFFNNLFDSLNGHKKSAGLGLKGLLTSTSEHHTFWLEACRKLTGMRFVKKDSKESNSKTDVPTMRNWIKTIASIQNVWRVVHEMGFEHLETRHLNQDCLENFFGQIRSHGRRNVNPNCAQFQGSFKTFLVNNLTSKHSVNANCENLYDGDSFTPLQRFVELAERIRHPVDLVQERSLENADAELELDHILVPRNNDEEVSAMIAATVKKLLSLDIVKGCEHCQEEIQGVCRDNVVFPKIYALFSERIHHIFHEIQGNVLF